MRACEYGLCNVLPHTVPGSETSAAYRARPVTLSAPSTRGARVPMTWYATRPVYYGAPPFMPTLHMTINGRPHSVDAPSRRTLVDLLRYDLGLTGTKEACSVGVCGACSVLVDGRLVASCIMLACQADGAHVTTIEGIADEDRLH